MMTKDLYEAGVKLPTRTGGVSEKIRQMPVNRSLYVPAKEATPSSVRTLVTRVSMEFKGRAYQTARERDGVRIWRTA